MKVWNYTTKGAVASSPTVADGIVYVGSYDGNIYALNEDWGKIVELHDWGIVLPRHDIFGFHWQKTAQKKRTDQIKVVLWLFLYCTYTGHST